MFLVSSVVVIVSSFSLPVTGGPSARTVALVSPVVLLVYAALLAWPTFRCRGALVATAPLLGVVVIAFLDLATVDHSAGAQVVFCLPTIFAASQLRILGAAIAAVAAVLGDTVVVLRLDPAAAGALDVVDLTLVVSLMSGLLVFAGRKQDRLVAMLESQAALDPLTGLVTRRILDDAMNRALNGAHGRAEEAGTALILIDVDNFKAINDNHGHPVGDDALVHVAGLLARQSRPDTVIGRLGGDEMAVLLPNCTDVVAQERAQEFLRRVEQTPMRLADGELLRISISVGVAHAPIGDAHLRELYSAADASLYEAKRAGRGRVGRSLSGRPKGLERVVDGAFEVGDVQGGVLERDVGVAGDDRLDHW
jgi:diguanylate cyclase (GGDEF)-like protein